MRNEKRYQDINEILAADINVISTVNVQHLESLNDSIFELTGIRVRETFPDGILDEADQVVLVDLTPKNYKSGRAPARSTPRSEQRSRSRTSSATRTSQHCASSCCGRSPRSKGRAINVAAWDIEFVPQDHQLDVLDARAASAADKKLR